jgi:O-antigen ligase
VEGGQRVRRQREADEPDGDGEQQARRVQRPAGGSASNHEAANLPAPPRSRAVETELFPTLRPVTSQRSAFEVFVLAVVLAALVDRGAFEPTTAALTGAVLAVAAVWFSLRARPDRPTLLLVVAVAVFSVVWIGLDARRGVIDRSLPLAMSAVTFAAGVLVARANATLERGLVLVGALVNAYSVSGWLRRISPLSLVFDDRYRLSGTMAYPNANGAFAAVALVLSATAAGTPRWLRAVGVFAAASVVAGSLSRGAVLAAIVGLVLAHRHVQRDAIAPALLGAGVGLLGIATSAKDARQFAVLGVWLVLAMLSAALAYLPRPSRRVRFVAVAAAASLAVLFAPRITTEVRNRATLASTEDRTAEWRAAFDAGKRAPLFGSGPERDLLIKNFRGTAVARYAHNEYLQVFGGGGIAATAALGCVLVAAVAAIRRDRARHPASAPIAVVLALTAGFDFVWHFTALVAFAALCCGLRAPPDQPATSDGTTSPIGSRRITSAKSS